MGAGELTALGVVRPCSFFRTLSSLFQFAKVLRDGQLLKPRALGRALPALRQLVNGHLEVLADVRIRVVAALLQNRQRGACPEADLRQGPGRPVAQPLAVASIEEG